MRSLQETLQTPQWRESVWFALFFLIVLVAAKFGLYLLFVWHTSPAVLWPPMGIIVAILWLRGYRFAIPAFLGLFIATLFSPMGSTLPALTSIPLTQALAAMVIVYLLNRISFTGNFSNVRDVVKFLLVVTFACMLIPSVTSTISYLAGQLPIPYYVSWSRAWAGYVFSCMILTPVIIAWVKKDAYPVQHSVVESVAAGFLILISTYFLFWVQGGPNLTFLLFLFFFIAQFWVGFRFSTRLVMTSVLATTVIGILGLFVSPNPARALQNQLLSAEFFFFLVVPILYVFSAVVKERAQTVLALQQALKRIEAESENQMNFISVLAHELRNPLAPVKSTLEILQETERDPDIHALIDSAHYQVHTMRRLLDDLLDITRVTQGKFQLQIERSNLCTMLNRAIEQTRSLFDKGQVFLSPPVCDDSIWLDVDPTRFEQAMVNILNNAAKYSPEGGTIETSSVVKGNKLEIRIKDKGIGIAQEDLENIFKPFWQVKKTNVSNMAGIGVGLSLTKHIIEMHGGEVHAESEGHDKGSVFIITMPFILKEKLNEQPAAATAVEKKHYKVLLVDDNHAAADSLARLLSIKGHETKTAYSGFDAITSAKTFDPDIILLDIGMPDFSGYEVARTLRADGFKKQIVALSGYGQREDREKALKSGCDEHIVKPMSLGRFETYLKTLSPKSI